MRRIELEQSFSHCFQSEPFQETTSLKLITLGIVITSLTQLPPTYAGNDVTEFRLQGHTYSHHSDRKIRNLLPNWNCQKAILLDSSNFFVTRISSHRAWFFFKSTGPVLVIEIGLASNISNLRDPANTII